MASAETVLLKSTLEIQNKPYSVKLTSSEIYWEVITSSRAVGGPYSEPLVKAESQSVRINEIITVRLGSQEAQYEGKFQNLEMVSLSPTMFSVWVLRRCHRHKWRDRKVTFSSKDTSVIQQWVDKIQDIICRPEYNRPKSLLVFINPVGGRHNASKIYRDKAAPLFEHAGISTEVITTQRQNHARDTLLDYDLSRVDGVICVGGDGMFTELVHGLLTRTLKDTTGNPHPTPSTALPQPNLRIGIIPAGSTDTVAYSVLGINDPVTSVLHIILGDSIAMDVGTVFHDNQFQKYNVSLCGYGYYGDCLIGSESNRWMGPKRYDWEGFKKVVGLHVYEGEISYVPSTDKESHPRDGTVCKSGCTVCQLLYADAPEGNNMLDAPDTEKKEYRVRGRFVAINSFLISCRCRFSPEGPAPAAHLGDGCADLVIVKECSRFDYVRHLFRCTKKTEDQVVRIREFQFRPLVDEIDDTVDGGDNKMASQQRLRSRTNLNSVWNCDGEVIEEPAIDFKVHRRVISLFARGIEDERYGQENWCTACVKS